MPLIMLVGIPCSGKSSRADEIANHFKTSKDLKGQVIIVRDEELVTDIHQAYKDSFNEKQMRGKVKAAVERALTKDDVVIVDSLNYIKGFRYELYCIARSLRTPHCVVYCDVNLNEHSFIWNKDKLSSKYQEDFLTGMLQRMEVPSEKSRWDCPLFRLTPDQKTPLEEIEDEMLRPKKTIKPNTATLPIHLSENTLMYELDKITTEIVQLLVDSKSLHMPGEEITLPTSYALSKEQITKHKLKLPGISVGMQQLRKLRTQFVKMCQMHPPETKQKIVTGFVDYLNEHA
ncbi:predicted protein [Naegleria gruberi]|uniref:Predicted protein n=1 Tax=Naegleria gruberi TaxID=5762 RepID=D2VJ00_NAEGR|nr:uncharacterized protein NAEGRDRAFT_34546 [Naegleria gruberi]EFC43191.1 predicted protein [Naegleria gruberi]|eukprot:XP_002675935.1 predicted protein [Naegleria gruberi strain NEG-M]